MEHVSNGAVTRAANGATRYRSSSVGVFAQPGSAFDLQGGQAGVIDRRIGTLECPSSATDGWA
eukprot:2755446-Prymnesium_polylepis.1